MGSSFQGDAFQSDAFESLGLLTLTGSGGFVAGGSARVSRNHIAQGGLVVGGEAELETNSGDERLSLIGSGGSVFGGTVTPFVGIILLVHTASGGLSAGGTVTPSVGTPLVLHTPDGGLEFGGEADAELDFIPPPPTFTQLYEEINFKRLTVDVIVAGHHVPRPREVSWTFAMGTVPTCSFTIDNPIPGFMIVGASVNVWVGFNEMTRMVFNGYVDSASPYEGGLRIQCAGQSKRLEAPYKRNIISTDGYSLSSNLVIRILQQANVPSFYVDLPAWVPGDTLPTEIALGSYAEAVNKLAEPFGSPYYEMPNGVIRVELRDPVPAPTVFRNYFSGIIQNGEFLLPVAIENSNPDAQPRIRSLSSETLLREVKNKIIVRGAEIPQVGGDGETDSVLLETEAYGSSPWIPDMFGEPQYNEMTIDNELLDDASDVGTVAVRYFNLYNRLFEKVACTVEGDPEIFLGATVGIIDPAYTRINAKFFVNGYTSTISGNDFSTSLELLGGRAAGVTPFVPPFALFTWTNRYSAIPYEYDDYRIPPAPPTPPSAEPPPPEPDDPIPYPEPDVPVPPGGGGGETDNTEQAGAKLTQVVPAEPASGVEEDPETGDPVGPAVITVAPSPAASGTTFTVEDASIYPDPTMEVDPVYLVIRPASFVSPVDASTSEVVELTGIAGNVLTVVRAQAGTTAKTIETGWVALETVVYTGTPGEDPVADAEWGEDMIYEGKVGKRVMITFDASASVDPDGRIVSYAWSDSLGHTGSGRRVTWAYNPEDQGSTVVKLTVTDSSGLTATDSAYVNINTESPENGYITSGDGPVPPDVQMPDPDEYMADPTLPDPAEPYVPDDATDTEQPQSGGAAGGAMNLPLFYIAATDQAICVEGEDITILPDTAITYRAVPFAPYGDGGEVVLFGGNGGIVASTDKCQSIAWTVAMTANIFEIIHIKDGLFAASGSNGEWMQSRDFGQTWETLTGVGLGTVLRVAGNYMLQTTGLWYFNSDASVFYKYEGSPYPYPSSLSRPFPMAASGSRVLYSSTYSDDPDSGIFYSSGLFQAACAIFPDQGEGGGFTVITTSGNVMRTDGRSTAVTITSTPLTAVRDAYMEDGSGGSVMVAVNSSGLYKSVDGGAHWGKVFNMNGVRIAGRNSPQFAPEGDIIIGEDLSE